MAIWRPIGRPADRPTGHPEKSRWLRLTRRSTALYIKRWYWIVGRPPWSTDPNRE